MNETPTDPDGMDGSRGVRRRTLLAASAASAVAGAGLGVGGVVLVGRDRHSPDVWLRPDRSDAPRVAGMHLQFGKDASNEVVVSWSTGVDVGRPRVMFGTAAGGFGTTIAADTVTYRDA